MTLSTVARGQRIRSTDHNSIVGLLKGTASYGDQVSLTRYSSASNPALTVRNTSSSGTHLLVTNSANTRNLVSVTDSGATIYGPLYDEGGAFINVKSTLYGAKGDTLRVLDGAMTSGAGTLTSASALFTSTDVGKQICVAGAGAASADLYTTIASYTSSTVVELTATASTTVTGAVVEWGTDDTTAITTAIAALGAQGGTLVFPAGRYLITSTITVGDGTSTTSSTRHGVKFLGMGGGGSGTTANTYSTSSGSFGYENRVGMGYSELVWFGSAGGTMLSFAGPIEGIGVKNMRFGCRSRANTGIKIMHAHDSTFENVWIQSNAASGTVTAGLWITSYPAASSHLPSSRRLVFINCAGYSSTNNNILCEVGPRTVGDRDVTQVQFYGCQWRADGTTGSVGIQLNFVDGIDFYSCLSVAATDLNIRVPDAGASGTRAQWPSQCQFYQCSIAGTRVSVDHNSTTWAPGLGFSWMPYCVTPDTVSVPSVTYNAGPVYGGWFGKFHVNVGDGSFVGSTAGSVVQFDKTRNATNAYRYSLLDVGGLTGDSNGAGLWRGLHLYGPALTGPSASPFLAIHSEYNAINAPSTRNWVIDATNSQAGALHSLVFRLESVTKLTIENTLITLGTATTTASNFSQTGATTFSTGTGAVSLNGAVTAGSTLAVTGATTLNGAVTLGDNSGDTITVTGTATVQQALTCNSTIGFSTTSNSNSRLQSFSVTLSNAGTQDLGAGTRPALIIVDNTSTGQVALFISSGAATTELSDPSGVWGASAGASAQNVYITASTLTLQNSSAGASQVYAATVIRL